MQSMDIGQIYISFLECFLFGGLQVHSKTTREIFTTKKITQLLQFLKKIKAFQLCIGEIYGGACIRDSFKIFQTPIAKVIKSCWI